MKSEDVLVKKALAYFANAETKRTGLSEDNPLALGIILRGALVEERREKAKLERDVQRLLSQQVKDKHWIQDLQKSIKALITIGDTLRQVAWPYPELVYKEPDNPFHRSAPPIVSEWENVKESIQKNKR
jgi:hypothetical protein